MNAEEIRRLISLVDNTTDPRKLPDMHHIRKVYNDMPDGPDKELYRTYVILVETKAQKFYQEEQDLRGDRITHISTEYVENEPDIDNMSFFQRAKHLDFDEFGKDTGHRFIRAVMPDTGFKKQEETKKYLVSNFSTIKQHIGLESDKNAKATKASIFNTLKTEAMSYHIDELPEYFEDTVFSKAEYWMSKIQPTNILGWIERLILADGVADVSRVLVQITESYGLYWNSVSTIVPGALALSACAMHKLANAFTSKPDSGLQHEALDATAEEEIGFETFLKHIGGVLPGPLPKHMIPLLSALGPILFLGLNSLSLTKPGHQVANILSTISKSCKDTTNLAECMDKVQKATKTGLTMAFDNEKLHMRERIMDDMTTLERDVETYKTRLITERAQMQAEFSKVRDFQTRLDEICEVYNLLICAKENVGGITPLLTRLKSQIPEIIREVDKMILACKCRQEPACLWIWGKPRVGKSKLVTKIIDMLSKIEGKQLTWYFRSPSEDYANNYQGQDVFVYDDFAAAVDAPDLNEFQVAKSCNSYQLNMASIEDKKSASAFVSRYIIILSNVPGIATCDKMVCPDALDGRRDLFFCAKSEQEHIGLADRVYSDDFSHMALIKMNPFKNQQGMYTMERCKPWKPAQIANELHQIQERYKGDYHKWIEDHADMALTTAELNVEDPRTMAEPTRAEWDRQRNMITDEERTGARISRYPPKEPRAPREPRDERRGRNDRQWQFDHGFDDEEYDLPRRRPQRGDLQHHANDSDDEDDCDHFLAENTASETKVDNTSTISFQRGRKPYVFIGETGLGKSFLTREIAIEAKNRNQKLLVADEFTKKDPTEKIKKIWKMRESSVVPYILTTNSSCWNNLKKTCQTYDFNALQNRVIKIQFNKTLFSGTKFANKLIRSEEVDGRTQSREITRIDLMEEILGKREMEEVVATSTTYVPEFSGVLPEKKYMVEMTKQQFGEAGVATILSKIFHKQIYTVRPEDNVLDMKVLAPLASLLRRPTEQIIVDANAMAVPFTGDDFCIIAQDFTIVVQNIAGVMRLCSYTKLETHEVEAAFKLVKDLTCTRVKQQASSRSMIFEVLDAIFFFGKMALTMGLGITGIIKAVKKTRKPALDHEGRLDHVYDDMKVPKSSRIPGQRIREYCPSCSSTDCYHCVYFESYNVRDVKPEARTDKTVVKKSPLEREVNHPAASSHGCEDHKHEPRKMLTVPIQDIRSVPVVDKPAPYGLLSESLYHEACIDNAAQDVAILCHKNTVFVGTVGTTPVQRALMTHNRNGVVNRHSMSKLQIGEQFPVFCGAVQMQARIIDTKPDKDIIIFTIPDSPIMYKDIRMHITTLDHRSAFRGQFGLLQVSSPDNSRLLLNVVLDDSIDREVSHEKQYGLQYFGHRSGVTYAPINSRKGYCGSPVLVCNTAIQSKIVAIHSAANGMEGFGAILYREWFDDKLEHHALGTREEFVILPHQAITPIEPIRVDQYVIYGRTQDQNTGEVFHQFQPTKTKLWDSPLALANDVMEPAVLSRHDSRLEISVDPYVEATGKYNRTYPEMDIELLDRCVDMCADYYADKCKESRQVLKVLTKTEAVNGYSKLPKSNPMIRDSSAGYPWKHRFPGCKKRDFLEFDDTHKIWRIKKDTMGTQLNHAVDAIIHQAKKGKRTAAVNIGSLKDEPRKIGKIKEGATRAFWAAPIDKTIADRMYFHAACAALEHICDDIPCKVGINPQGMGFHKLYCYHAKVSTVGFDLDAKNWDSSVHPEIIRRIHRVFNKIYQECDPDWTEEDDVVRTTLAHYVDRALVLIGDGVVMLPGGNNSGQTNTSQFNSIANHIVLAYIWCKLAREAGLHKLCNLHSLNACVASSFYGDDLMLTVTLRERTWFNPRTYIAEGEKIGIIFTPADKSGKDANFSELRDMEFLKRNFVMSEHPTGHSGRYYSGALQLSSFHHMLDVCACNTAHVYAPDKGEVRFDIEAIRSTCLTAQLEAVNHGKKYFHDLQRHLKSRCHAYDIMDVVWISYTTGYNMIWETDLLDSYQTACVKEQRRLSFESITHIHNNMPNGEQPAVVGEKGGAGMVEGDSPPAGAPLSPQQGASERSSGVIDPATGSSGMLPSELYQRNIAIGNITWSTSQNTGTILFEAPVSPAGANVYVQYFSALYNAWAGGLEFSVLLAGTGFNGGKLCMVHVPPNFDISNIQGLQDITIFPYKIVDVKEAGECSTLAHDERNILFHWRNTDIRATDSTGGTFAIFVLAPLVNSNGVPGQVNIVVFNRPSPGFRVAQLMPLQAAENLPNNLLAAADLLPEAGESVTSPYTDKPIHTLKVNTPVPEVTMGEYGAMKGDGTPVAREYVQWGMGPVAVYSGTGQTDKTKCNIANWAAPMNPANDISRPLNINYNMPVGLSFTPSLVCLDQTSPTETSWNDTVTNGNNQSTSTFSLCYQTAVSMNQASYPTGGMTMMLNICEGTVRLTVIEDPEHDFKFYPLNGESVVTFTTTMGMINAGTIDIDSLQCSTTINALRRHKNLLKPGQAIIYQVYDVKTNLPIGFLKFYYEGVFTTTPSSTVIEAPLDELFFKPVQIIDVTEFIPITNEISQNQMLVETRRRRGMSIANVKDIVRQELLSLTGANASARSKSDYIRTSSTLSRDQ